MVLANVEFADLTFARKTTITKPTIALTELVEKEADADLLKQMIQFVTQRMMEFDVEGLCNASFDAMAHVGRAGAQWWWRCHVLCLPRTVVRSATSNGACGWSVT